MLHEISIEDFLDKLASRKPVPGGGSVAALSGALAAGLVAMAAEYSTDRETADKARGLARDLMGLIDRDARAFAAGDLKEATEVPLQTARWSYEVLKLAGTLLEDCNPRLVTDVGVAAKMAEAALEGALLNVQVNLISVKDEEYRREMLEAADELRSTGRRSRAVLRQVHARLH
ncbi:MAG: cyclodeaminase/cyclohydrolase family protein [Dehalococcoidia bacterium]